MYYLEITAFGHDLNVEKIYAYFGVNSFLPKILVV